MALFDMHSVLICRSHRFICLLAVVAALNYAWPFETNLFPVKTSYAIENSRLLSNNYNIWKQQTKELTNEVLQAAQSHTTGASTSGIPVSDAKQILDIVVSKQEETRSSSPAAAAEPEKGNDQSEPSLKRCNEATSPKTPAQTDGACSAEDSALIFWRKSLEDYQIVFPKRAQVLEGFLASVGGSRPSNPFYETVLFCGRCALGTTSIFIKCVEERLQELAQKQLSASCMQCFAESLQCGVGNCRGVCLIDSCSERCLACSVRHCGDDLLKCTGLKELPPACLPEETSLFDERQSTDSNLAPSALWTKFLSLGV